MPFVSYLPSVVHFETWFSRSIVVLRRMKATSDCVELEKSVPDQAPPTCPPK